MQNSIKIKFYIPIIIFILAFSNDAKSDLNVVSSIKPIHSITAAIMEGVSEPTLIVDNIASPHSFNLKPSHIEAINGADLIFYVSEDLETFIEKPLDSINKRTNVVELISNEALILLKFRKDIIHSVDDEHEDEEHHDEHEDEEHHDEHEDEEHHHEHIHEHGEYDAHIWLDTFNAKVIANQITIELSKLDPNNRYIYQKNRDNFIDEVDALERTINQQLNHYVSFVTFHDAYQYFENRFDVPSAGALTVNPDVMPGAHQLTEIRDLISYNDIHCIFSEPQFNPKIIEVIADDTNVKMGVLDPLGVNIPAGKDQYFSILKNIANKLEECGHNH